MGLTAPQEVFLEILMRSLGYIPQAMGNGPESEEAGSLGQEGICLKERDLPELQKLSRGHKVMPLLYDFLMDYGEAVGPTEGEWENLKGILVEEAKKTAMQSYRLLFLTRYICNLLEERKITVIVLKGVSIATYYPVPEMRKSGDIDLLLPGKKDLKKAIEVLKEAGFTVEKQQRAHHHISMHSAEGIEVELHSLLCEPVDSNKINSYLKEVAEGTGKHMVRKEIMGVELPVLEEGYLAFSLLLHMLQHYLRAGFGIKLLCDLVVFWKEDLPAKQKESYRNLVKGAGLEGFSNQMLELCIKYLGLEREKVQEILFEETEKRSSAKDETMEVFLKDILEGEEFGKAGKDRMVSLRGGGLGDYVREFHHQMHLNFPKLGRVILLWPFLWSFTLFRFLRNNRVVRKVSLWDILRKAGKRGKINENLQLFQVKEKTLEVSEVHGDPTRYLKQNQRIKLQVRGVSMFPLLEPQKDVVTVAPFQGRKLRVGDLVLYRREEGILVLHRICRIKDNGFYLLGDHQTEIEGPLKRKQFYGRVVRIEKSWGSFSASNPLYVTYVFFWLALRRFRPTLLKLLSKLKKSQKGKWKKGEKG